MLVQIVRNLFTKKASGVESICEVCEKSCNAAQLEPLSLTLSRASSCLACPDCSERYANPYNGAAIFVVEFLSMSDVKELHEQELDMKLLIGNNPFFEKMLARSQVFDGNGYVSAKSLVINKTTELIAHYVSGYEDRMTISHIEGRSIASKVAIGQLDLQNLMDANKFSRIDSGKFSFYFDSNNSSDLSGHKLRAVERRSE